MLHLNKDMPNKIKLIYYNLRGRAELIRYVLVASNIEFEEERIERHFWPSVKSNYELPANQIPVVILPDGTILNENLAIARYFANQNGLIGLNYFDQYRCDRAIYTLEDLFKAYAAIFHEKDPEKKSAMEQEVKTSTLPKFLQILTRYLHETDGPFFLGDKPSYADLHLVNILDNADESEYQLFPEIVECRKQILKLYPAVQEYRNRFPKMAI